jgi:lysophospholipase L1-like esterase
LVQVVDIKGNEVARGSTILCVRGPEARPRKLSILLVGDSITYRGMWVDDLCNLIDAEKLLTYELLGTNQSPKLPRARHEGYGGWTWERFLTHYKPGSGMALHRETSPFVFMSADGKPRVDLARYFRECLGGKIPDIVVFEMGMNDVFCLQPDDAATTRRAMAEVADHADALIEEFRRAAPDAILGVMMPPQFSTSQVIFPVAYAAEFSRWRNRRLNHAWLSTMQDRFGDGRDAHVSLIPTYASIDAIDGYAANDPGHPNEYGARQYAVSVYAWMKDICFLKGKIDAYHSSP